jgi:uncharacterized protein GlcG (DUF336 family)
MRVGAESPWAPSITSPAPSPVSFDKDDEDTEGPGLIRSFRMNVKSVFCSALLLALFLIPAAGFAAPAALPDCSSLMTALGTATDAATVTALKNALTTVVGMNNGGFGLPMWGTVLNRRGEVCWVFYSGGLGDEWPGSRVISAQKANTANAFSLPGLSLATANLYTAVQPGGSLFGLQESNPVNPAVAYAGDPNDYGTTSDALMNPTHQKIGGVNVFGGGLALYSSSHVLLGAIGVSGDTSCADHTIAWRLRHALFLDYVPAGVSGDPARPDNIVYDITKPGNSQAIDATSKSGWGHPHCLATDINPFTLPATR